MLIHTLTLDVSHSIILHMFAQIVILFMKSKRRRISFMKTVWRHKCMSSHGDSSNPHVCSLERGHSGSHKCLCDETWDDTRYSDNKGVNNHERDK